MPPIYPSLVKGLTYTILKTPEFATLLVKTPTGLEMRIAQAQNPIWHFQLIYDYLYDAWPSPQNTMAYAPYTDLRAFMGFFLKRRGQGGDFLFFDPVDYCAAGLRGAPWQPNHAYALGAVVIDPAGHAWLVTSAGVSASYPPRWTHGGAFVSISDGVVGGSSAPTFLPFVGSTVSDGTVVWTHQGFYPAGWPNAPISLSLFTNDLVTYYSPLQRYMGGFLEDVTDLVPNTLLVYANGALQVAGTNYTIGGPGPITIAGVTYQCLYLIWTAKPTLPTATFQFYFRLRFEEDTQDFERWMANLWTIGGSGSQSGSGTLKLVSSRACIGTTSGVSISDGVIVTVNASGVSISDGVLTVIASLPVWVTASILPSWIQGAAVALQLSASSATTYALSAGTLPAGISLSATGLLSGTPTTLGVVSFSVAATGTAGTTPQAFTAAVVTTPPVWVTSGTIPSWTQGTAVSLQLTATAATAYALSAGTLPAGITLSATGLLSGTPTTLGVVSFSVAATGTAGTTPQAFTAAVVTTPPVWVTSGTIPSWTQGTAVSLQLTATAATAYALSAGTLPAGITLSATGLLSGTPTGAGAVSFSVAAIGPGGTVRQAFTSTILIVLQPLSTSGSNIVDHTGATVILRGVNWHGGEGSNHVPLAIWARSYTSMIDQIASLGANVIRLPLSADLTSTTAAQSVNTYANPDLVGLTALQILDKIIDYAASKGIYVFLDCHRLTAGAGTDSAISGSTLSTIVAWWQTMATHFASHPGVCGADLYNEPYTVDWPTLAGYYSTIGRAIQAIAPNWLIICEGTATFNGVSYWWGGQLAGAATTPVSLTLPHKLVYSAHDYGQSVGQQPWLESTSNPSVAGWPANCNAIWDAAWGYLVKDGIAPVIVGEFGGRFGFDANGNVDSSQSDASNEKLWLSTLLSYMAANNVSATYWTFTSESGDTGGLLEADDVTLQAGKIALLTTFF